jgi:hypothetical protein
LPLFSWLISHIARYAPSSQKENQSKNQQKKIKHLIPFTACHENNNLLHFFIFIFLYAISISTAFCRFSLGSSVT